MFIDNLKRELNHTTTENGASAYWSTEDFSDEERTGYLLDAFSLLGIPSLEEDRAIDLFDRAYMVNPKLALKLLFYMRDIRGGQGVRKNFRTILKHHSYKFPQDILNNLDNIAHYGRWDDYLCLVDTPCEKDMFLFLNKQLNADLECVIRKEPVSLLAKWLPSINASSVETKKLGKKCAKAFGLGEKQYRKILSRLRKYIDVTETKMSSNNWDNIDFSKVPSRASLNYGNAFYNHTPKKYLDFLLKVANGDTKINAGAVLPVDIVHRIFNSMYPIDYASRELCNIMWKSLPNYFEGHEDESVLCVVDVSGSMYGTPMEVAISLGLYCAEKCKGAFHNHFITFSSNPTLVEIDDNDDLYDTVNKMERADWGMNTDIVKVFDLILKTAIKNNSPQSDLPNKIYIISDMQFDNATGSKDYGYHYYEKISDLSLMESLKQKYIDNGYEMPSLVYWNVRASNCGMFQETKHGVNCCMVGGYSPSLFKAVVEGTTYEEEIIDSGEVIVKEKLDPIDVMLNTLNSERYNRVIYLKEEIENESKRRITKSLG